LEPQRPHNQNTAVRLFAQPGWDPQLSPSSHILGTKSGALGEYLVRGQPTGWLSTCIPSGQRSNSVGSWRMCWQKGWWIWTQRHIATIATGFAIGFSVRVRKKVGEGA
jgi:hypothetical protein